MPAGGANLNAGSGVRQRPVRRGEQLVRVGRRREGAPLERGGAEREDPRLLEGLADLPHQVQVAVHQEPAEDVEPADHAVALVDVHLERQCRVAGDPVAEPDQRALEPERLADHVDRVGMAAHVAEVGVAVVAEQLALAHRAEQGPVGQEGLDPGVVQCREHDLDGVHQRLDIGGATGVEGDDATPGLVEAERLPVAVEDLDPPGARAEGHLLVEDLLPRLVHDHREPGGSVEELLQGARPGHPPAAADPAPGTAAVAVQPERVDPPPFDQHVHHGLPRCPRRDAVGVDGHVTHAQETHGRRL